MVYFQVASYLMAYSFSNLFSNLLLTCIVAAYILRGLIFFSIERLVPPNIGRLAPPCTEGLDPLYIEGLIPPDIKGLVPPDIERLISLGVGEACPPPALIGVQPLLGRCY
jgi:hypothetical protein